MWMDNWVLNSPLECWPAFQKNKTPVMYRFFESKKQVVVLSSSNNPATEAHAEECAKNHTPILRRKGGGGTVVLGPGCLILTFAFYAQDVFGNEKYFKMINELWIQSLKQHVPVTLSQRGISDISCGEKKIAGTSIFRKKNLLVYQGSMLVDVNIDTIGQLLQHPTREPDYRKGRPHREFLTTLAQLGCTAPADKLALSCQKYFNEHVTHAFKNEFYHKD